ncbi:DUF692 domain-containing protein [Verrucosispora sioxanthis]|uniref:DUF692 domain-containing protein n=1 Tax=Verrucosispora sioxanthis TaxID=2499994 RepID=A0A6M1L3T0_9ACTN|nr:DUF692 domain-containing protein [Verrucosispora sioxanthis]NEE64437.1 DUF692 domain-containing protein [Verrucosispora sioxanthis]NGM13547.1 DUF692 domain-containing protein [Verrucosispora sioxanthis]
MSVAWPPATTIPRLGVGVGLRAEIEQLVVDHAEQIDWLELITEDYLFNPHRRATLAALREHFPLIPHGVELSIGSAEPVDEGYLSALAELVALVDAPWCSDHLCFTRAGGIALSALLPLPRTEEVVAAVADKVRHIQQVVGVPFLLENISAFIDLPGEMPDAEFLTRIVERADCGILLDLTNVYNNAVNHQFDPLTYLDAIPLERVVQVHLAGGTYAGDLLQDNHRTAVHTEVWDLLRHVLPHAPISGFMIERDGKLPDDFPEILADIARTREVIGTAGAGVEQR